MVDLNFNLKRVTSIFGSLRTGGPRPEVQIDAIYGLKTKTDTEVFSATGGSVDVYNSSSDGQLFRCQTGTSVGGYGLIRSQRSVRYKPGQEVSLGITAAFEGPVALGAMRAGGVTSGSELSFGYDGANFGVLRRRGGKLEHYRFDITAAATGNETVTVTLDDTEFEIAVTSGTDKHNAFELSGETYAGWSVWHNDDSVYFLASALGDKTGSFSMVSDGTFAATAVKVADGAAAVDTWAYQNTWNVDRMDGTGPSSQTLDPTALNLYRIRFGYLGAANIVYEVYSHGRNDFYPVHIIQNGNVNNTNLSNPYFKLGWFAASLGSTTNQACYGGSSYGEVQGPLLTQRNPEAEVNSKTSVGTTFTNILTVRVRRVFQDRVNLLEALIKRVSFAVDGTKPAEIEIVVNATLAGEPDWQYVDQSHSIVEYDTAATTVTIGSNSQRIFTDGLARQGNDDADLESLNVRIVPLETITIAGRATSGTTDITASATWEED